MPYLSLVMLILKTKVQFISSQDLAKTSRSTSAKCITATLEKGSLALGRCLSPVLQVLPINVFTHFVVKFCSHSLTCAANTWASLWVCTFHKSSLWTYVPGPHVVVGASDMGKDYRALILIVSSIHPGQRINGKQYTKLLWVMRSSRK